jgi:hypothetical protein
MSGWPIAPSPSKTCQVDHRDLVYFILILKRMNEY